VVDQLACPLPLLTVLPAFVLSTWRLHYAAIFLPMILFWGWNPKLFGGQPNIPRRSYALVLLGHKIWANSSPQMLGVS